MKRLKLAVVMAVATFVFATQAQVQKQSSRQYTDWKMYGGGEENIHYSTLAQITPENVHQLEVAWRFDTGDEFDGSEMQCNPIVIGGVMYATTPKVRVIALDAATGKLIWSFDPNEGKKGTGKMRNRGVTFWDGGATKRVFFAFRHRLYSLDARTGKPDANFGEKGSIDLRRGLGRDSVEGLSVAVSTPGVVYKDMLIVGSIVSEALPAAPGDIRAFDLRSGKLRWGFRTIPEAGEFGADTWPKDARAYLGGANNWMGLAVDQRRGLVFAPTGSGAFDFYGGNRHGDNLFANTLLCLDANTGRRVWHFQGVKHDVWDRDFPSAPALVTVKHDGRDVEAVAQLTKSGHVYLFERETGKPLFPVEYRKYPASSVEGETLAETQPLPLSPPPFSRQRLTEEMLTQRTPEAHKFVLEKFRRLRSNGQFEPPSMEGTVIFPGFDGGAEWGGGAFDPETGWYYVNANEMAWVLRIVEKPKPKVLPGGKSLYEENCASCHKRDLSGSPPEFPSLKDAGKKLGEHDTRAVIRNGRGRMPGFARLGDEAIQALALYVRAGRDAKTAVAAVDPRIDQKYTFDGYNRFLDQEGFPAVAPPWGTLNAIDLNAGRIVWQIPFGEYPNLAAKGMKGTGSENYGGSIVTRNGLLFIGATNYDKKLRAFDKLTGKVLWETLLPAAGNATPAMYEAGGRQFLVIAAGGGKWGAPSGGSYVAFALPAKTKVQ